jgi:hypothetical protein
MPERPSTTGSASGPASSSPWVRSPGRVRTQMRDNGRFCIASGLASRFTEVQHKCQTRLLFYPRMLYFAQLKHFRENGGQFPSELRPLHCPCEAEIIE